MKLGKQSRRIGSLAMVLAMLFFSYTADAHSLWLNFTDYMPAASDSGQIKTKLYIGWGHRFPVDSFVKSEDFESIILRDPMGREKDVILETTGFAALLASAGVAVGMALSGNLSNFAGGLIILVFKPFKVGDYIDGPGVSGTIKEIQIFHTILSTLDNRMIYVPNGMLSGNAVINYSKQEMRRVEWVFGWNMERMYKGSEPYCNVLFMRTNVFWILLLLSLF